MSVLHERTAVSSVQTLSDPSEALISCYLPLLLFSKGSFNILLFSYSDCSKRGKSEVVSFGEEDSASERSPESQDMSHS